MNGKNGPADAVQFLKSLKADGPQDVEKVVTYLMQLQKVNSTPPPPIAEFITILKYEKPVLHALLKRRLQFNMGLSILFQLDLDLDVARKRLNYDQ